MSNTLQKLQGYKRYTGEAAVVPQGLNAPAKNGNYVNLVTVYRFAKQ